MKKIIVGVIASIACIGTAGCAIDPINWKPVAGWETLNSQHRAQTIAICKESENFTRCMYSNDYAFSKNGSVMPLDNFESEQEEISVTEFKQ